MAGREHQLSQVLREPGFRQILAVRFAGQSGDGCFQAGLAAFALFRPEHAPSAMAIAAGFAVLLLPFSLVGPAAGVLLDRWSRRRVLVLTNIGRAVVLLVLALLLRSDPAIMLAPDAPTIAFVVLALVALGANRLILAALGASLPHLVPRRLLVPGNGLAPTMGTVAYVIGTGVGALLRGVPALVLAGVLYLASAELSRRMPWLGPDARPKDHSAVAELRRLFHATLEVRHHLTVRAVTALATITAVRLPLGILIVTTLVLERGSSSSTTRALSGLTLILGGSGLGFAAAALLTPRVVARIGLDRTVLTHLTAATVSTLIALPLTIPTIALAAFLVAWATQGVKICVDTALQQEVADIYRGRVFTWYDILFNGAFVVATLIAAVLLPPDGRSRGVVLLAAPLYLVVALLVRRGWALRPDRPSPASPAAPA